MIPSVPAVLEADTREATRDAVQRRCVGASSVWYRFTPTVSGPQRISTIGSNYDTVLAVYSGARSPRTRLSCDDDAAGLQSAVRPDLVAGQQYWIAVSSCCGTRGGDLVLRLPQGETPPSVELEIEEVTAGAVSGRLRVHGVTTCATPSVVQMQVTASQRVGSGVARGAGSRFLSFCSTDPTAWVDADRQRDGLGLRPRAGGAGRARGRGRRLLPVPALVRDERGGHRARDRSGRRVGLRPTSRGISPGHHRRRPPCDHFERSSSSPHSRPASSSHLMRLTRSRHEGHHRGVRTATSRSPTTRMPC